MRLSFNEEISIRCKNAEIDFEFENRLLPNSLLIRSKK